MSEDSSIVNPIYASHEELAAQMKSASVSAEPPSNTVLNEMVEQHNNLPAAQKKDMTSFADALGAKANNVKDQMTKIYQAVKAWGDKTVAPKMKSFWEGVKKFVGKAVAAAKKKANELKVEGAVIKHKTGKVIDKAVKAVKRKAEQLPGDIKNAGLRAKNAINNSKAVKAVKQKFAEKFPSKADLAVSQKKAGVGKFSNAVTTRRESNASTLSNSRS